MSFFNETEDAQFSSWTSPFFTNQVFGSREEMMNWAKITAYSLGYVLVTQRSKKYKNGFIWKVHLMCDRSGKYGGPESSTGTSTKKTDCPFQLIGQYSTSHGYWTIRVVCDQHNHLPTQNLEGHAYAKRLSDDEYRLVEDLTWKNVRPREILSTVKDQNENNLPTLPTCQVESQHVKLKDYLTCRNYTLDKFIVCIDKIVMSQLTAIKESFGRSEISRYHKNNIPCFSLLRGAVSNEALNLMVKEIDWSNGFQLNSSTCGCQLHNSCGLPCACRLSLYVHSGECIPLNSIDIFWRTLNLSPAISLQSDNIRCDTKINQFKEHFNKQSEVGKRNFLRKLVDIFNPSKNTMKPPVVKKNTRGRPMLKKQKKYAPPKSKDPRTCSQSARFFGIDLNTEPERHSSYANYQTNYDRDPIPDLNEEPARHSSSVDLNEEPTNFFDYIPENFHPHIIDFYDVRGDGNCGFRSVTLGLGLSEDQWPEVRSDLVRELTAHRERCISKFRI